MRNLDKKDTFSFMLSAISAAEADPNYTVLADLIYLLNEKEFKRFMGLFEGQTIRIPSTSELNDMLGAILLYAYVDLEGMPIHKAMGLLGYYKDAQNSPPTPPVAYVKLRKLIKQKRINVGGVLDGFPPESLQDIR